jgi:triosephosphate isomerase
MRKKIVAGNWKMNKTVAESAALATELVAATKGQAFSESCDIVICPTFLALDRVGGIVKGTGVKLGAQDMHWENQGAFTSKISQDMLKALGVTYVILGHSELRTLFGETDENVRRKTAKAIAEGLTPIICVGETLAERDANVTEQVITTQVKAAYQGLSKVDAAKTVIAYEPVWAIGTGRTASDEQAQSVHKFIRGLLLGLYDLELAQSVRNAAGLLHQPDVDGGLIGGASLKVESFLGIIKAA